MTDMQERVHIRRMLVHISGVLDVPVGRAAEWFAGKGIVNASVILLAAGVIVGCQESVNPFVGSEIPFTVWGFMNAGSDTQYVRVFPISDQLVPDRSETIDAEVFSTDLTTGQRRQWSYDRVQFDSLIQGHIFWSPFRAEHEHRYTLEVIRSDGATSSATVMVPPPVDFRIDVDSSASTVIPVRIAGDVPNLIGLRVSYHAVNVPPAKAWPVGTQVAAAVQLPVSILYDNVVRRESDAWHLEIDLVRDFVAVQTFFDFNCLITSERGSAPDIWLRGVEFSALAADSSWAPPGGVFDPNLLSVPGTFSNVDNGYGFFGAGMGFRHEWTPTTDVALAAGYSFEAQCNYLSPVESSECMDPPVPCVGDNATDLWRIWLR